MNMDQSAHIQSQLELSRNTHDMSGIDRLRQAAQSGDKKALTEAAQQFEAIFVKMMMQSMRNAQDALADKDSPFNSQQVKFYRDMHDTQLATDLSATGSIGLADVIVQQLGQMDDKFTPASVLRRGANLSDINRHKVQDVTRAQQQVLGDVAHTAAKRPAFANKDEFIQQLLPAAQQAAAELGISAKAMLAQAAVETGWGQYMIHGATGNNSHNLFGIKADKRWQGDKAVIETVEFTQGVAQKQKAPFRAYGSFAESMQDYVQFVKGSQRYADAVDNATQPQHYFNALQRAGYATDPGYADKIMSVYNSKSLAGVAE